MKHLPTYYSQAVAVIILSLIYILSTFVPIVQHRLLNLPFVYTYIFLKINWSSVRNTKVQHSVGKVKYSKVQSYTYMYIVHSDSGSICPGRFYCMHKYLFVCVLCCETASGGTHDSIIGHAEVRMRPERIRNWCFPIFSRPAMLVFALVPHHM